MNAGGGVLHASAILQEQLSSCSTVLTCLSWLNILLSYTVKCEAKVSSIITTFIVIFMLNKKWSEDLIEMYGHVSLLYNEYMFSVFIFAYSTVI